MENCKIGKSERSWFQELCFEKILDIITFAEQNHLLNKTFDLIRKSMHENMYLDK